MLKIIHLLTEWNYVQPNFVLMIKIKIFFRKDIHQKTYVINDLNGDEVIRTFYEKEIQKTNQ